MTAASLHPERDETAQLEINSALVRVSGYAARGGAEASVDYYCIGKYTQSFSKHLKGAW